jgi:hypothetical protein
VLPLSRIPRTFKTAWFSKAAQRALVSDAELCAAIREVELGQADDLGGGVFKKRIDKKRRRAIILARSDRFWVYEYLFAKKDRANISSGELADFRVLVKGYATLSDRQPAQLIADGDFEEICNE